MATTVQPVLSDEGNLRLASQPCTGIPLDWDQQRSAIQQSIGAQPGVELFGPLSLFLERPPTDDAPSTWRGQIGLAVIGQPKPAEPFLIEDFHRLQAVTLPHYDSLVTIAATHRQLVDHARAMGWMLRPYWRLALAISEAPDGHLVPEPLVSVFVDR